MPIAMNPPIFLFGKTPKVSVTKPANATSLITFEAIVSPYVHRKHDTDHNMAAESDAAPPRKVMAARSPHEPLA